MLDGVHCWMGYSVGWGREGGRYVRDVGVSVGCGGGAIRGAEGDRSMRVWCVGRCCWIGMDGDWERGSSRFDSVVVIIVAVVVVVGNLFPHGGTSMAHITKRRRSGNDSGKRLTRRAVRACGFCVCRAEVASAERRRQC